MISTEKTETENIELHIEAARLLETVWRPGRAHSVGDYVRPIKPTGFEYDCTAGGQTGSKEPRWPTTIAQTVVDGSVTWTCRAFGTQASDTVQSVATVVPTGITANSPTFDGTEITLPISGGRKGRTYEISLEITTVGGEILEEKILVEVTGR